MRKLIFTASVSALAVGTVMSGSDVEAKIFENDTFRLAQEATNSFGLFINDQRATTINGSGSSLTATFTGDEMKQLLLANNNLSSGQAALAMFTEFLAKDLAGLFNATFVGGNVNLIFSRDLVENNESGTSSFKYTGPLGSDRNFVRVTGQAIAGGGDDDDDGGPIVVVPPGDGGSGDSGGSRGGAGPFYNDTFKITATNGGSFQLSINGIELTTIADTGGDISFSIPENTLKALLLVNNGVTGQFLGDGTEFFEFLAKGNSGLIDVTLGSNVQFDIDRSFVFNELSGESSFKYNAGGKKARNFVNFMGVVNPASPSS